MLVHGNDNPWDEPFSEEVGGGEDTVREDGGSKRRLTKTKTRSHVSA
jgi:hypothetical protein